MGRAGLALGLILGIAGFLARAAHGSRDAAQTIELPVTLAPQDVCARKGRPSMCVVSSSGVVTFQTRELSCNLQPSVIRPRFCRDGMMALLSFVTALLEMRGISYWLTQGTLLGAVREGALLKWGNDVDISTMETDWEKILAALAFFSQNSTGFTAQAFAQGAFNGFYYSVNRLKGTKWISVTTGLIGTHLDIYPRRVIAEKFLSYCNVQLHADCDANPVSKGRLRFDEIFPLRDGTLHGKIFFFPNNPEAVLEKFYGPTWSIADRYGEGGWLSAEDMHATGMQASRQGDTEVGVDVVYIDCVCDILHAGHIRLFRRARKLGQKLVVGVHNDSTVESYKRLPVMLMEERITSVAACKYVDKVVPHAPLRVTTAYMKKHRIDLVVHGDDLNDTAAELMYGDAMRAGKFETLPYTPSISTTDIIRRIVVRSEELMPKLPEPQG